MQIFCSKAYTQFWNTILISAFSLLSFTTLAQTNSPYSRFGIGDLIQQENISNLGMGGVSNAVSNFGQINYSNPASYPYIGITTIQLGATAERIKIAPDDSITGSMNIAHLNIGIPINKNGGLSFGLIPESRVGYRQYSAKTIFDTTEIQSAYSGGGGIQKLYMGYGYKYKDFSVGANINFLFGNYSHNSINQFLNSLNIYDVEEGNYYHVHGFNYNLGVLYLHNFKGKLKGNSISVGVTFQPQSNIGFNNDYYMRSYIYNGSYPDTIINSVNVKSKFIMPSKFGVGLLYSKNENWKLGLDYNQANWNCYTNENLKDSVGNNWGIKVGGTYHQTISELATFWKRIEYRAGFFTGKDYYQFYNKNLNSSGVTFGAGVPLKLRRGSFGTINLALQSGVRGTLENNLSKENFTRFSIGISLSEKWFLKQRFD